MPLLNSDSEFLNIKDNLDCYFDTDYFVKPSKDQKSFNGGILKAGTTVEEFILSQPHQTSYMDEKLLVCDLKEIKGEYRFFVVNSEVITGSQYFYNKKINVSSDVPENIYEAAKKYAQLYHPHEIFTLDLCETDKDIFIVEYNCWNISGLYKCDALKIFKAVQEHIGNQKNIHHIKAKI